MKPICRLISFLLYFSPLLADGQAPTFMPIEPNEDFYSGSNIALEVYISDQSSIKDALLFYRFSSEESFSSVPMEKDLYYYTGVISGINVVPGKMEYYFFARDEHGNQSMWPSEGEELPENLSVITPKNFGFNMLTPKPIKMDKGTTLTFSGRSKMGLKL